MIKNTSASPISNKKARNAIIRSVCFADDVGVFRKIRTPQNKRSCSSCCKVEPWLVAHAIKLLPQHFDIRHVGKTQSLLRPHQARFADRLGSAKLQPRKTLSEPHRANLTNSQPNATHREPTPHRPSPNAFARPLNHGGLVHHLSSLLLKPLSSWASPSKQPFNALTLLLSLTLCCTFISVFYDAGPRRHARRRPV